MFSIGLFAIITDGENRVLLCHRTDYDLWNLPGGGMEHGETPWKGVVREMKEELGVDIEVERLVDVACKPHENDIIFTFLCDIAPNQAIKTGDDVDRAEFFEFDRFPGNTSPRHKERVKGFLEQVCKGAALRKQMGKSTVELIWEGKF
ncbi:hypothetical protein A2Y83_01305 [Candidatus Falkowbacteria bacterium RBG_13_39_14]|uniref:Nudix hydrolase domain-containing protein n=1 Tax=Candidatus Falkowbacteria bacterium RBG_13_39_14 TaxID=1797985 RepID=A0A1F5S4E1_9BACT|nr:MAG: hypothetical protein A2Y83_01305 [Candidatus Falkowbacteria bacterium RBG_13_39_14]